MSKKSPTARLPDSGDLNTGRCSNALALTSKKAVRKGSRRHGHDQKDEEIVSGASREAGSCGGTLGHLVRQALFALLWHQEATAKDLRKAVNKPLKSVDYHLKILVRRGLVQVWDGPDGALYSLTAAGRSLTWMNSEAAESVLLLSFLDVAWAAVGAMPEIVAIRSRWGVFPVDEIGLIDASKSVVACLTRFEEIVRESRDRRGDVGRKSLHTLVAVASVADSDDGQRGRQ